MRRRIGALSLGLVAWAACGGGGGGDDDGAVDAAPPDGGGQPGDQLDTAIGCAGVFNPDQLLDLTVTMAPADWDALRADTTNSIYYPAQLACGDDPPQQVGIRRKRSGGTQKVGLKLDVNLYVDQRFHGLNKLSLENGVSEGGGDDAEARDLVAEYLSWRFMVRSGAISGRAVFVRVTVNGEPGVYVNVEQVDKRFLRSRLGEDDGWLYKKSGSADDGYKTRETEPNPYEGDYCFWRIPACAPPPAEELATELPVKVDLPQLLRIGAVNAMIANGDAILLKDNNYYFYDRGVRHYLPWDLDTTMARPYDVFTGTVPGGTSMYTGVLFPQWAPDYLAVVRELLAGPLAIGAIDGELDRALAVAAAALDADPRVTSSTAAAVDDLRRFWRTQHAAVTAQAASR